MDPIANLRAGYAVLNERVLRSLRTQVGDAERLQAQRTEAIQFLEAATLHQNRFPPAEFATLVNSINSMTQDLDSACHQSADPVTEAPLVVCRRIYTGRRGRPRLVIDREWLAEATTLRNNTDIGATIGASSRHVRRALVGYNLAAPGPPVRTVHIHPDGTQTTTHTSSSRPVSTLTDDELDSLVAQILEIFPLFGRRMLQGHLSAAGHRVPAERLRASYLRVHGAPGNYFGRRFTHRRAYKVAGANSLWHHDGQHGLIRYKIVIHCFVDGKTRFVVGIRASNNNRAETVLDLFLEATQVHGVVPSRSRGDHGTENVLVARWMEQYRGPNRGSYIWGRSVHNTRIERLWYDVTTGFGEKWKQFFIDLELHHGLVPTLPAHIWLLHYLFLDAVNQDAQDWANSWNSHVMQLTGERNKSPREMYFFSMLEDGPRGLLRRSEPIHEDVPDPESYGIDWEAAEDPALMAHLLDQNPQDWEETNPFATGPSNLSDVPCIPPNSPFTLDQIQYLQTELSRTVDMSNRNMLVRRQIWVKALALCNNLFSM